MADQASKDAAGKARILKHMNADHQASLTYYLQYYSKLPARAARNAELTDISFSTLTIRDSSSTIHTVPINPPMTCWADARPRVVAMDQEAREGLGISDIRVTAYERPGKPLHVLVFGLCLMTMGLFAFRKSMDTPGSWWYDSVLKWFPGGQRMFFRVLDWIVLPVASLHIAETWWFERSRLGKYGVERGSSLWFKWVASCFVEGVGCVQRFDAAVKRKRVEKEMQKH